MRRYYICKSIFIGVLSVSGNLKMRPVLLIFVTLTLLTACNQTGKTFDNASQEQTETTQKIISQTWERKSLLPDSLTKITGDFNGDGQKDFAVVIPPFQNNSGQCEQCVTKIAFSNNIDSITISTEANGAMLFNVGDLDGNKTDELLLIPDWMNSCWGLQSVYTYKNNTWDTIVTDRIYRCNIYNRIKKIKNGMFDIAVDTGAGGSEQYLRRVKIKQ
jgi:hypothetical protein